MFEHFGFTAYNVVTESQRFIKFCKDKTVPDLKCLPELLWQERSCHRQTSLRYAQLVWMHSKPTQSRQAERMSVLFTYLGQQGNTICALCLTTSIEGLTRKKILSMIWCMASAVGLSGSTADICVTKPKVVNFLSISIIIGLEKARKELEETFLCLSGKTPRSWVGCLIWRSVCLAGGTMAVVLVHCITTMAKGAPTTTIMRWLTAKRSPTTLTAAS